MQWVTIIQLQYVFVYLCIWATCIITTLDEIQKRNNKFIVEHLIFVHKMHLSWLMFDQFTPQRRLEMNDIYSED